MEKKKAISKKQVLEELREIAEKYEPHISVELWEKLRKEGKLPYYAYTHMRQRYF